MYIHKFYGTGKAKPYSGGNPSAFPCQFPNKFQAKKRGRSPYIYQQAFISSSVIQASVPLTSSFFNTSHACSNASCSVLML